LRFGLVAEKQTANRTKLRGSVQKSSEFIRTLCGFLRFRFGLGWFVVFLLCWFGFEHPYFKSMLYGRDAGINQINQTDLRNQQTWILVMPR